MFNFDKIDIQRVAVAALGAIILSTVSVTAAVGPARAIETASIEAPAADEAHV
jgi:hypothetical protein